MTNLITHFIPTTDCTQIQQHPYWISLAYPGEVLNELDEMGIIEELDSSWASPIVVVKKDNTL